MVDESHKLDTGKEVQSYERFLVSERKSRHTVKQYKSMLKCFFQYVNKDLRDINNTDIENFKNYLVVDKKYSKASQYLSMKVLKSYYSFKNTPIPVNLSPPRRSQKMPVYLNDHDAHRLLGYSNDVKIRAIISTFLYTGIRVSELTNILINDVDLQENIIYVNSGKGDKDRIVVIPDSCKNDLNEYLKIRLNINTPSKNFFVSNKKTKFDTSTIEKCIKSGNVNDSDFIKLKNIIRETGSYDYSISKIEEYTKKARDELKRVKGNQDALNMIDYLSNYLINREN